MLLKTFFSKESRLPKDLRDFLKTAPDTKIVDELIVPIEWVTAADQSSVLTQTIKSRLVLHGQMKGIAAEDAEDTLGALYHEVWTVATRDRDRALDRADFIRVFDHNTRASLPKTTIAAGRVKAYFQSKKSIYSASGAIGPFSIGRMEHCLSVHLKARNSDRRSAQA